MKDGTSSVSSEADGAGSAAPPPFSCSVLAVGTELLLGQVVDSNSAFIGERLALAGIDSHLHVHVGDNLERIATALRTLLAVSDAVIVCGGLGPTQDDISREAIAAVMGVGLERDPAMVERIEALFARRGRAMAANNLRQADRPVGAEFIVQELGSAPGLVCPVRVGGRTGGLRRARRAGGDAGDGGAGRRPRPAAAGGAPVGDRQPHAADVGDGGVDPGRAHRPTGSSGRRTPPSPSWRRGSRGSRSGSRPRRPTWTRPRPCSTRRRPSCGRSSARWCSASTTSRWRRRWATCWRPGG